MGTILPGPHEQPAGGQHQRQTHRIVRDKDGKPYSVRYDQVNAMLLNEFLKEHRTVMELQKEIAALAETVKDQAAQIQKVCAHLEIQQPNAAIAENQ